MKKDPKKTVKKPSEQTLKVGETVLHDLTGHRVEIIKLCKTRGVPAYIVEDKRHIFRAVAYELSRIHVRSGR